MSRRGDSIYHRKDGLWEARYMKEADITTGKKKYASVYGHSYLEAKEKRDSILEHMILYKKPPTSMRSITVARLVDEWLRINQTRIRPSTYQRYYGFCKNHILPDIGNQLALYLTTVNIHNFAMGRLQTGITSQTVNAILVFLHSCLKYGSKQYALPLPEIVYLACEKKEMKVLTKEDQAKLVRYLTEETDIYKLGVLLALYTGLRIGELCALHWGDISEDSITVRRTMQRLKRTDGKGTELFIGSPKTSTSVRTIPLPSFLKDLIETFRPKKQEELYFLGVKGKPVTEPRVMQYKFKRFLAEAGIYPINFHGLRHSFASRCVELGAEPKCLSELMGHAKVQTTLNLYVHVSADAKRKNIELLGQVFCAQ